MPRKKKTDNIEQPSFYSNQEEINSFFSLSNNFGYMGYNSTYILNDLLKSMNNVPAKYTRDNVITMLESPQNNEKQLRSISNYLLTNSMFYKRVVNYFATMLTFDNYVVPVGVELKEMRKSSFKKNFNKIFAWFDKFNVKYEFGQVMSALIEEGVFYAYKRENQFNITFQRLPADYCMIINRNQIGYVYAFNLIFFTKMGVNINDYPEELQKAFEDYKENKGSNWFPLSQENAIAWLFDDTKPLVIPPLLGIFLDALEIREYKNLLKTKTELEAIALLVQRIPMRTGTDAKGKNEFLIDLATVAKYHTNAKTGLPSPINVLTTPMEIELLNFNSDTTGGNKANIVGQAENSFYSSAGIPQHLFSTNKTSVVGIAKSIMTDESFVINCLRQFEKWINYQLFLIPTGQHMFHCEMPDITYYNRDDKLKLYLQAAQAGTPKTLIAATLGIKQKDMISLADWENSINLVDKLKPLQSSHTSSSKDSGRPQLSEDDLTEKGIESKERDDNSDENRD